MGTKSLLGAVALVVILSGCASGYQSFYRPAKGATPEAIAKERAAPAPAVPLVERSAPAEPDAVLTAYAKRGYVLIGHSMFNSGRRESEAAAVKQGQKVGADLVLIFNPQYTGSVTTHVPLTTPTTSTSHTTGSATAFGPGGPVTAYGNATTTTYGSKTTYIPRTVDRSDYGAVYFVKQKFAFGAFTRDLNDTERRALETNQGAVVLTVVDGTPAFMADILPGDVVRTINGEPIYNSGRLTEVIAGLKGQNVRIALLRNGQPIQKQVQLNR